MTRLRLIMGGERPHLSELEPELKQRLVALEEPPSRESWADVVTRTRAQSPHRLTVWFGGVAAAAMIAAVAAGSAVMLNHAGSDRPLALAAGSNAAELDLGNPSGGAGIGASSPVTVSLRLSAGSHVLYVSKGPHGDLCYEWQGLAHGCQATSSSLRAAWNNARVVGTVAASAVSSVDISFTDGTSARPSISWVPSPIGTGFFSYAIPAGKKVAAVIADDHGFTRGQVPWYAV